jgi:hypothetical protein
LRDDGVDDWLVLRRVPRAREMNDREFHPSFVPAGDSGIAL